MRHQASHGALELRCAQWIEAETGSSGSVRGAAGGWRLESHLYQGAGGPQTAPARQQTENGSSGSACGAAGGWRATCTGERADRGPALWKQQTESVSWEHAPPSISRSSGAPVCSLDPGRDRELWERAWGGCRAACTGEQADSRSAPARHQTETRSSGSPRGAAGDWQLAGLETQRTETRQPWK